MLKFSFLVMILLLSAPILASDDENGETPVYFPYLGLPIELIVKTGNESGNTMSLMETCKILRYLPDKNKFNTKKEFMVLRHSEGFQKLIALKRKEPFKVEPEEAQLLRDVLRPTDDSICLNIYNFTKKDLNHIFSLFCRETESNDIALFLVYLNVSRARRVSHMIIRVTSQPSHTDDSSVQSTNYNLLTRAFFSALGSLEIKHVCVGETNHAGIDSFFTCVNLSEKDYLSLLTFTA